MLCSEITFHLFPVHYIGHGTSQQWEKHQTIQNLVMNTIVKPYHQIYEKFSNVFKFFLFIVLNVEVVYISGTLYTVHYG